MFIKSKVIISTMIISIALTFFAITILSAEETKKVRRVEHYIAVIDLETDGNDKTILRPLSDSIRQELVKSGKYNVIDRSNMDKILKEQAFQLTGCISGKCMVEVGQLLGVGKIITGSVSLVGKTYYLSLSLVNVETGKVENMSEDKCRCEVDDLIESSKRLAKKLMGEEMGDADSAKSNLKKKELTPQSDKDFLPGMDFVNVKGGCYEMGDMFGDGFDREKPVHEVCVDDFYIGKYEVTQGLWKKVMGDNPSKYFYCGNECPVENVSWDDIQEFLRRINQKTGKRFRLPTEAEWEYAARSGGKKEKWAGTNDESELDKYAWFKESAKRTGGPHKVGGKKPNSLGVYDMTGNVAELVQDSYNVNAYNEHSKKNPIYVSENDAKHVFRDGFWFSSPAIIRCSSRNSATSSLRFEGLGFRLAFSTK